MRKSRIGLAGLIIVAVVMGIIFHFKIKLQGELAFYEAKSLFEEKKYGEAYLALSSLLKRYYRAEWLGEAIFIQAKSLNLLGRHAEAVVYWQRLKDKYGEDLYDGEIIYGLALGYEAEGKVKEARGYYEKVINEFPKSFFVDKALLGIGRLLEKEGGLDEAVAAYQKVALNSSESNSAAEAFLSIAELYEKKEEREKALELYYKLKKDFSKTEFLEKAEEGLSRINMRLMLSPELTKDSFIYKVEAGDNLAAIAKKFNTTVEFLMEANRLAASLLKPGQRLKIWKGNLRIRVSKAQNKLYLENNGRLIKVYKIATGKDNTTPEGRFTIVNKLKDPVWYAVGAIVPAGSQENILGSRWLGLSEKGYGLHGTNNLVDIGGYVTNGCIRLVETDLQEIYILVPVGTSVEINRK